MIRVALVDDEPLARDGLRARLEREPGLEIVGEAGDVASAVALIARERPDLVFLDVQMPDGDGFDVLDRVAGEVLPEVVFVTAFGHHAVRAFEVHALDYLLKPLTAERFGEALRRVRAELSGGGEPASAAKLSALLDDVRRPAPLPGAAAPPEPPLRRFVVRSAGRFRLVAAGDVRWISAAGNYAELHTATGTHLVRVTLAELERRLDPACFARIHRSALVALDRVREILPVSHGDFEVVIEGGERLSMSRTYRDRLMP